MIERLQHAVELLDDQVEPAERVRFELTELLLKMGTTPKTASVLMARPWRASTRTRRLLAGALALSRTFR
jgi:hypothetical protein